MKLFKRAFFENQRGATMVEFLLTLGLAAAMIPFLLGFQTDRIRRAENIAITREMQLFQNALEKYITTNKSDLEKTIGKSITRVDIVSLSDYGISEQTLNKYKDKIQLRILKSDNDKNQIVLQGVIVLNDADITSFRTNEIVNLGDSNIGYIQENQAYGVGGTWQTNTKNLDLIKTDGLVKITKPKISQDNYLWRLPSDNNSDATMLNSLNMANRDITNVKFFDGKYGKFGEYIKTQEIQSDTVVFETRSNLGGQLNSASATISGTLSSDSTNMYVSDTISLTGVGKFDSIESNDLWVNDLNLSGLYVSDEFSEEPAILKILRKLELTEGTIYANYTTVGFDGSITPRLIIGSRIEDASNPEYFWDADLKSAKFSDVTFAELNRLSTELNRLHRSKLTVSTKIFQIPANNQNATITDFINALNEIEALIKIKYQQLNLE